MPRLEASLQRCQVNISKRIGKVIATVLKTLRLKPTILNHHLLILWLQPPRSTTSYRCLIQKNRNFVLLVFISPRRMMSSNRLFELLLGGRKINTSSCGTGSMEYQLSPCPAPKPLTTLSHILTVNASWLVTYSQKQSMLPIAPRSVFFFHLDENDVSDITPFLKYRCTKIAEAGSFATPDRLVQYLWAL